MTQLYTSTKLLRTVDLTHSGMTMFFRSGRDCSFDQ